MLFTHNKHWMINSWIGVIPNSSHLSVTSSITYPHHELHYPAFPWIHTCQPSPHSPYHMSSHFSQRCPSGHVYNSYRSWPFHLAFVPSDSSHNLQDRLRTRLIYVSYVSKLTRKVNFEIPTWNSYYLPAFGSLFACLHICLSPVCLFLFPYTWKGLSSTSLNT